MRTMPAVSLRPFAPHDALRLHEIEGDEEMVRYQDFPPRTEADARAYVDRAIVEGTERVITLLEEPERLIGRVGSWSEGDTVWLWYVLDRAHQGQGLARAAVSACMAERGPARYAIECHPGNQRSRRLAEALGFRLTQESSESVEYRLPVPHLRDGPGIA